MKKRAKVVNLYDHTKRVQYIDISQEEYEEILELDDKKRLVKYRVTTKAIDKDNIETDNIKEAHNYGIN